jgi:hypothetical protein
MSANVRVAISMTDGRVFHMLVVGRGRFPARPRDGYWQEELDAQGEFTGFYVRDAADSSVISFEINKSSYLWVRLDPAKPVLPVSWRVIAEAEHALFDENRVYRNALTMRGDKIEHDMPRARECHRVQLRKIRTVAMAELDAEFSRYVTRDSKKAESAEAKRQMWRDAPQNPRIEAAKSIEDLKKLPPL